MTTSEETRRRALECALKVLREPGSSKAEKMAAGLGLSQRIARAPSASAFAAATKALRHMGSSRAAYLARYSVSAKTSDKSE
jgi:hypothetical protein